MPPFPREAGLTQGWGGFFLGWGQGMQRGAGVPGGDISFMACGDGAGDPRFWHTHHINTSPYFPVCISLGQDFSVPA